jgi:predicted nucleotidyltransferase
MSDPIDLGRSAARRAAVRHPALTLIVLFGSRGRGDARSTSDWDFAYAASRAVDPLTLRADLVEVLETDRVDVVPLDRASALLRYRVARDGVPLFQRHPGNFARFWLSAVEFWCDVIPLVRAGHEAILAELAS